MPLSGDLLEPPVVEVRHVSVSFGGWRALDDVSIVVAPSGVTAIIGPNGAGKTTLLNCVSGLVRHSGDILIDGRSQRTLRPHRRCRNGVARTYQTPILLDDLTALDNVMFGAHVVTRGWVGDRGGRATEAEVRRQALDLLDRFGMADLADRFAGDLPHPDRRHIETTRALISRPRALLLDEPAAGLDGAAARDLITLAAEYADACLLVSHDMPLVTATARHVVVLVAGAGLAAGAPRDVVADARVIDVYLGERWLG